MEFIISQNYNLKLFNVPCNEFQIIEEICNNYNVNSGNCEIQDN